MFFSVVSPLALLLAISYTCLFVLADPLISSFPNSLTLDAKYDPIKAAYWTGLPHHRRTPFAVSPDGKSAYLAYLDSTYTTVHVLPVSPSTFQATGTAYSTPAFEAGGLVAHNDGFALLATVTATSSDASTLPPNKYPIVYIIRVSSAGKESWRTALNGPGIHASFGLTATPDINGDLVYSPASDLYAAYFVVTAYTGDASGHFGDSIQYVSGSTGALQTNQPDSSTFGCSHNTGIGFEAADSPPFASVCAEDQGAIWLNTDTRYMSGVKIANENTTNGVSGEPMGGMSGSYSNLASFPGTSKYIFAWQSRGAVDLTQNAWLGGDYTQCSPRWLNHNVAVSAIATKDSLVGAQASSTIGAAVGDSQVNWVTYSSSEDHQNVHVATFNATLSLVTYEILTSPTCQPVPLGCTGTYAGTAFQLLDANGNKVGAAVVSTSVFVQGDIANVGDKLCWPYSDVTWDLSKPAFTGTLQTKLGFACASAGGSAGSPTLVVSSSSSSTAAAAVGTGSKASSSSVAPAATAANGAGAGAGGSSPAAEAGPSPSPAPPALAETTPAAAEGTSAPSSTSAAAAAAEPASTVYICTESDDDNEAAGSATPAPSAGLWGARRKQHLGWHGRGHRRA